MGHSDKIIQFGSVEIDAIDYASRGAAVLGIRDSGKTYTATLLAENLFDHGIPFIAFDPIGVWWSLRVPASGKGYPVVVAGGEHADVPLTPATAPQIVRAAMEAGVSLVIDLFDIELSKADWKRIVMSCIRVLVHENKRFGLRHVFLEEAAEFVPQRVGVDTAQVYAEVEKLARMGGNSRLGYTLINQRAEEVNKAVLELCDYLFLHRQKGRHSITALSKWMTAGAVDTPKAITDTLSTLPTGECWAWVHGSERPVLTTVPVKNSAHPDRRQLHEDEGAKFSPIAADEFIGRLKASLKGVGVSGSDAPQTTAEGLQPLSAAQREAIRDEAFKKGYLRGHIDGKRAGSAVLIGMMRGLIRDAVEKFGEEDDQVAQLPPEEEDHDQQDVPAIIVGDDVAGEISVRTNGVTIYGLTISGGQRKILEALRRVEVLGVNSERIVIAALAGYSAGGGGFRNYIGGLRTQGLITYPDADHIALTDAGRAAAPAIDEPASARDVREAILKLFPQTHQRLLSALISAWPEAVTKAQLAQETGYAPTGGGFRNYLGALRRYGVITYPTSETARAADLIFPHGRKH